MSANNSDSATRYEVVIIGGSLAGLLCGVALKHAGHNVRILEQYGSQRESQATGLGLGPYAREFIEQHLSRSTDLSHTATNLQIMGHDGTVRQFATGRRDLTSWDAVFYRLRSEFDGHTSPFCAKRSETFDSGCSASYEIYKRVLGVQRTNDLGTSIILMVQDTTSQEVEHIRADFVIGADGPNSLIRALYLPDAKRGYAGYVMWRGLVPESEVSSETRALFQSSVIAHKTSQNSSCVMYMIPGVHGSLKPGERLLNFIWYTNETKEDLDGLMTDSIDGHCHRSFVPPGRVRDDIWAARLHQAKLLPLPGPFLEVVMAINRPSLQIITDYCSPHAAFEQGHILLIGDALSQFRPHAALGVSQAAFHANAVQEYLAGRLSCQQWESRVVGRSHLHWCLNVWWGDFYQKSLVKALPAALRYWTYNCLDYLISWWTRKN